MSVSPEYWRLILRDYYNERALVRVVLYNGAEFQGQVHASMWDATGNGLVILSEQVPKAPGKSWAGHVEKRHSIDIEQVCSVSAAAA